MLYADVNLLTSVHPFGKIFSKSLKLSSLSANFTSFALWLELAACSICNCFRTCFSKVLSSVTSRTMLHISDPKCSLNKKNIFKKKNKHF